MTFEQWMQRPVYVTQCYTAKIAREMCGIFLPEGRGLATKGPHPLDLFRAYPQYRDAAAQGLRNRVADQVRRERAAKKETA
jgi:hypothetical protein